MTRLFTLICLFCLSICDVSARSHRKKSYIPKNYDYELSVAAIFHNEAPYLREWIEYYKLIGVEHFYLYNHCSDDNYFEVLKPYIESAEVDLIEWRHQPANLKDWDRIQIAAYNDALGLAKQRSKWLAIVDSDEFIVPCVDDTLVQILKRFEASNTVGICLIWSFFGTSHIAKIPEDKLLIESLIYHSGPAAGGSHQHVFNQGAFKSVFRPDFVTTIPSPHYCAYLNGFKHVMAPYDLIHINHYWTRDEYYFDHYKIPRRQFWGQDPENARFWARGMNNTLLNNPILRFVPSLRTALGMSTESCTEPQ